jgi:hypothetical protein
VTRAVVTYSLEYSGTIEVPIEPWWDNETVIAIAKEQLYRQAGGHPPVPYSQSFKVKSRG